MTSPYRSVHVAKPPTLNSLAAIFLLGCSEARVPGPADTGVEAQADGRAAAACATIFDRLPEREATAVSFRSELMPLFAERCNFGGCHLGEGSEGQLQLGLTCVFDPFTSTCTAGDAGLAADITLQVHANLLAPSNAAPALHRVEPGNPERSFILMKLAGCQNFFESLTGCSDCGKLMPPNMALRESDPELFTLVAGWIAAGAPAE
jgi:hypothetical protein